jgi:hypothetical protein
VSPLTRAVLIGVFAVVLGIVVIGAIVNLSADPDSGVEFRGGDERFEYGNAERAAERVAETGPDCFADPSGGGRPVCVNHTGDDPETGWVAFLATESGDCGVEVDRETFELVDCDGNRVPPDGAGLTRFPVEVDDGLLVIDLR